VRNLLAITFVLACSTALPAATLEALDDATLFESVYTDEVRLEIFECAQQRSSRSTNSTVKKPWTVSLTQTADYGTNLTLPIGLTPANTLVQAVGVPPSILDLNQAGALGILNILGFPGPPGPPPPTTGFFPDDFQYQTTAGLSYQRAVGRYGTLTAAYSYYQNLHPDVKQLDLQSHTPTVQLAVQLTERVVATSYYTYSYYFLDGNSYVNQNRTGTFLTFMPNQAWDLTLRGDYNHANFQPAPFLNSDNYAGTIEATRYLRGARNDYLRVGFGSGYSDAEFRGFSYQLTNVYAQSRKLFGAGNQFELRLLGSYGIYNFFGTDPLENVVRDDRILTGNIYVGRTFKNCWQVFGSYTYLDSFSTVNRQLYDSSVTSVGLTYTR
jgi:hypothetical protein